MRAFSGKRERACVRDVRRTGSIGDRSDRRDSRRYIGNAPATSVRIASDVLHTRRASLGTENVETARPRRRRGGRCRLLRSVTRAFTRAHYYRITRCLATRGFVTAQFRRAEYLKPALYTRGKSRRARRRLLAFRALPANARQKLPPTCGRARSSN